jgi:hypothetical protein
MIYGAVLASFCCEGFGLCRTTEIKRVDIEKQVKELEKLPVRENRPKSLASET